MNYLTISELCCITLEMFPHKLEDGALLGRLIHVNLEVLGIGYFLGQLDFINTTLDSVNHDVFLPVLHHLGVISGLCGLGGPKGLVPLYLKSKVENEMITNACGLGLVFSCSIDHNGPRRVCVRVPVPSYSVPFR